jgi:chemotaxis protein MotB
MDESGILVMPTSGKAGRASSKQKTTVRRDPQPTDMVKRRRIPRWLPYVIGAVAVLGGAIATYILFWPRVTFLDPTTLARGQAMAAVIDADVAEARVTELEAELATAKQALIAQEEVAAAATKQADKLAEKAAAAGALEKQLAELVGASGDVSTHGEEIHLQLIDKVLFKLGEAELTPRGKAVLSKLGTAIGDLVDKQIWVQGHTDDSPMRATKGVPPRYASNWELSAARALTVVHYLEDEAGIDPALLAAVAFGEHRPASRVKAKNRRIEIVLYPRHVVSK